jgi:predicted nucleotidyltransferase
MNNNIAPQYKELILKAIAYHYPEAKVILFGSRARGTHRQGSDIDLALNIGEPIKLREMARIRVTLANLPIPLEMDIVDMHNIPIAFKEKIVDEGQVWKD